MLVECGYVRATTSDGTEWTFAPSLERIAALGSPQEIVRIFAGLHGPSAANEAAYVLATLCEQNVMRERDGDTPLVGWHEDVDGALVWRQGLMPASEQVILARHLMQHGIVGKAAPSSGDGGKFSDRFDAAEYIAAARVHLGLSSADAAALSMTEFQLMLEMKFPDSPGGGGDMPTREEHDAAIAAMLERRRG